MTSNNLVSGSEMYSALYIHGLVCENGIWRNRYKHEVNDLYGEPDIVAKTNRIQWAGLVRVERRYAYTVLPL